MPRDTGRKMARVWKRERAGAGAWEPSGKAMRGKEMGMGRESGGRGMGRERGRGGTAIERSREMSSGRDTDTTAGTSNKASETWTRENSERASVAEEGGGGDREMGHGGSGNGYGQGTGTGEWKWNGKGKWKGERNGKRGMQHEKGN